MGYLGLTVICYKDSGGGAISKAGDRCGRIKLWNQLIPGMISRLPPTRLRTWGVALATYYFNGRVEIITIIPSHLATGLTPTRILW
jgi:hypothetical protein